jgi:hypothetical protein
MRTWLLQFTILVGLLAISLSGCAVTDDATRYGDDLLRVATRYGDDIAKQADDIGRSAQKSDEAVRYWDDILRASGFVDDGSRLLYRTERLTPVQASFVSYLKTEGDLEESEALLYLQGVCYVAGKLRDTNKLPPKSISQKYIEEVAQKNGIPLSRSEEFTVSFLNFTQALINENPDTDQKAASTLFNGLCLVTDIYSK